MSDSETSTTPALPRNEYTIGWVCALSTELTAATAMLDSEHELPSNPPGDKNVYTLGSIGKHNIVVACLPKGKQGTTSAAVVATQMLESFSSIRFGLMIGVGGGIPTKDHDIRLGDVVVSTPTSMFPGVVQLDLGKAIEGGGFERIGSLNNPPNIFRLDSMEDILFASDDITKTVERKPRDDVKVHYGLIASGNKVIKDAILRDRINGNLNHHALCVEMEAAGLMDNFPCLVIRGICDYADSYKNDDWQGYAAATAAAFAKELLSIIPASDVEQMEGIKIIASKISEISEGVKKIHQGQERHARNEILEWLTPVNYDAQHHEHLSKRRPDSGKWLLEHPNFQQLLNGDEKTLLCQGNPGAGKTILTSAVIDHLQHWQSSRDTPKIKVSLAFIYFDFIRKESQRTIDVLASLVKQLVRAKPCLPTAVEDLQKKYKSIPASSRSDKDIKKFSEALKHLISDRSTKTFIVIDALDESQDSNNFLENIFTVLKDTEAKLFATTRPTGGVKEQFKSGLFLDISASTEDVKDYIHGRLPEFTVLSDENDDIREELKVCLKREIVTQISSAIDGIFLLAKFHVDSLLTKTTLDQIRKTLQDLPRGPEAYKQAYEKTIIRIRGQPSEHQQLAKRTLQWLACAAREITALELRHALAIRDDSSSLPSEEVLESTNFVVKVCMGLVLVEGESRVIRLLHHTALEYLQENMVCLWSLEDSETVETRLLPPKSSKCAMQEVHQGIAKVCIKYLSFEVIRSSLTPDNYYTLESLDVYPFLEYTIYHWARHWREGFNEMSLPVSMVETITIFLGNEMVVTLIDEFDDHEFYATQSAEEMTILQFVAFFGLTSMIDACLNDGHDIHATTRAGENALWFALVRKHEDTSKALLRRGAKEAFIVTDEELWSSLGFAIYNGMGVAADLLRDDNFGAIINPEAKVCTHHEDWVCSCYFMFPLLVAAQVGDLKMTKMLLQRGAKPHAGNNSSINGPVEAEALIMAVEGGYEDVVECLLQADGSAVNAVDKCFRMPLYWAINVSRWSTANVLLRFGGKLYGAGTDSDPGLPANVSLINGQPSSIRFWGLDSMPVDISK
ncbi:hypothetical protein TGAM01_v208346 [Trichoderma gamsii]|uniref:Uncharacterized protein n=1 Tax=Trichoderma gamsii TaxID=398673 RepID=A0A2P4ZEY8_9HYPO|nr:hypothetical protein TGAM01_v208346 [Trichoderma gamsii]PON22866.1 hypothetical protein TGAM01_v208346 [Trichoderma gamsii]